MSNLYYPCPKCGTQNIVKSDSEVSYCTMCGSKNEFGIHSYRSDETSIPNLYCSVCGRVLEQKQNLPGMIFSCVSCGAIICDVCGFEHNKTRFCTNCQKKAKSNSKNKDASTNKNRSKLKRGKSKDKKKHR